MLRTVILSETPRIPTFRLQIPRTISWICTPAAEALYSASIISGSHKEFILALICARSPRFAYSASRPIMYRKRSLSQRGARISLFQDLGSE